MAATRSYSKMQIDGYRRQSVDRRRHLLWAIPLVIAALAAMLGIGQLVFIALVAVVIGVVVFRKPGTTVKEYDTAATAWNALLERSRPDAILNVSFPLAENELVFYSEPAMRYEERRTGQVIDTESKTKNAIGSAALGGLLFGRAGAIVGGSMARRQTTGTATDVYNVVPVDHGTLAVTSVRVVFLGTRDTIEIVASKIMRFSTIEGTDRINVEYAGRAPGESYGVNPPLFNLSMVRRAKDARFALPQPPPPLSADVNDSIALGQSAPAGVLKA